MNNSTLVRAWKDEDFREELGIESPIGAIELSDAELDSVEGGFCIGTIIIVICKAFSIVCAYTIAVAFGD
jgi:mersacidin/lichenicidin family type 2 lantibiotic